MALKAAQFVLFPIVFGCVSIQASAAEIRKLGPSADKYGITDQERAACSADAIEYCSDAYPDEDKLLECMKLNRANLSSGCRLVFDNGVHRRHL